MSVVNLAEKENCPCRYGFRHPFIVRLGHGPAPVYGDNKSALDVVGNSPDANLDDPLAWMPMPVALPPSSPHLIVASALTISMIAPLLGVENAVSTPPLFVLSPRLINHDPHQASTILI